MSLGSILFGLRKSFGQERRAAARRLLAVAHAFQAEHRQRVGVQNPFPYHDSSRPGEYPRRRTGQGQAGVIVEPESEGQVAKQLFVDVGYSEDVPYMQLLVDRAQRLGLETTLEEIRPRLEAIAGDVTAAAARG